LQKKTTFSHNKKSNPPKSQNFFYHSILKKKGLNFNMSTYISNASARYAGSPFGSPHQGVNFKGRSRDCVQKCRDMCKGHAIREQCENNCLQRCNIQKFSDQHAYNARDRYPLRAKQFSVQPQCNLVSRPNEGYPLALADMRPCGPPSCPYKPWPQGNLRSVRSPAYY
jgi:hypothetical protein